MRDRRKVGGVALITTLALLLMLSLAVAGAGTYAVGHLNFMRRNGDYALAIELADAGANFELRYISDNEYTAAPAHQASSPYVGTIPGLAGQYTVWVTNTDGSSPWSPPNPYVIHAVGQVNGATRQIDVAGHGESMFQPYSVLGSTLVLVTGAGSQISGNVASMTDVDLSGAFGTPITGETILAGPLAIGPTNATTFRRPNAIILPTIDQIVNGTLYNGWNWLTSNAPLNRANQNVREFQAGATGTTPLTAATTQAAGGPWTGTNAQSETLATSDVQNLNNGPDGTPTIVLPPGDYYFTNVNLTGGVHLILDSAGLSLPVPKPGLVRIWIQGGLLPDNLVTTVTTTSTDPSLVRIYDENPLTFTLGSGVNISACIYSENALPTNVVLITGGALITGSVYGSSISISGGSKVQAPASGSVGNASDFSLYHGFINGWVETANAGQEVFPDGTSN